MHAVAPDQVSNDKIQSILQKVTTSGENAVRGIAEQPVQKKLNDVVKRVIANSTGITSPSALPVFQYNNMEKNIAVNARWDDMHIVIDDSPYFLYINTNFSNNEGYVHRTPESFVQRCIIQAMTNYGVWRFLDTQLLSLERRIQNVLTPQNIIWSSFDIPMTSRARALSQYRINNNIENISQDTQYTSMIAYVLSLLLTAEERISLLFDVYQRDSVLFSDMLSYQGRYMSEEKKKQLGMMLLRRGQEEFRSEQFNSLKDVIIAQLAVLEQDVSVSQGGQEKKRKRSSEESDKQEDSTQEQKSSAKVIKKQIENR